MALGRIASGDRIVIVDMENALNYSTDMADNVHPYNGGYAKMAEVWREALVGLLGNGPEQINHGDFDSCYLANGWSIDVNQSFAVRVDFHYSSISNRSGWIGMNISDGADYVSVSAGSDSDLPLFYYEAVVDGNIVSEQELRTSNDGTLYCRYDAGSNVVYLSHVGFDSNDAYHWRTTLNPLYGQWSSPVSVAIGGSSGHIDLEPGEAYLENFEMTDAKLLDWPPQTDLDYNGYIELPDLADLCEYWLQTGTDIPADFYPDETVDLQDLSTFGLAW